MRGAETHLSTPGFRTFCAQANTGGAAGGAELKLCGDGMIAVVTDGVESTLVAA